MKMAIPPGPSVVHWMREVTFPLDQGPRVAVKLACFYGTHSFSIKNWDHGIERMQVPILALPLQDSGEKVFCVPSQCRLAWLPTLPDSLRCVTGPILYLVLGAGNHEATKCQVGA